jgi:cytochrome c-type biogenesis protein CcmH/NrfF
VLIFLGFAGEGLTSKRQEEAAVQPNQSVEVGPYVVAYKALSVTQDAQKQMVTAEVSVTRDGKPFAEMYPARWYFFGREAEPTTEVALRRGFASDLHLVLADFDVKTQEAHLQITINPLVNWIWFGVAVMMIGTIIALMPERAFSFATSRVPSGAVPTSLILIAALTLGGVNVAAQHDGSPQATIVVPRTALEKDLQGAIVCMCGGCGRKLLNECAACSKAAAMRAELAGLVAQGKDRDAIIQHFITEYGSQEVLAAPIDRGFNRLAWLLPYVVGIAGIAVVGGVALRWTRRHSQDAVEADTAARSRPDLEDRLDDELRELD